MKGFEQKHITLPLQKYSFGHTAENGKAQKQKQTSGESKAAALEKAEGTQDLSEGGRGDRKLTNFEPILKLNLRRENRGFEKTILKGS